MHLTWHRSIFSTQEVSKARRISSRSDYFIGLLLTHGGRVCAYCSLMILCVCYCISTIWKYYLSTNLIRLNLRINIDSRSGDWITRMQYRPQPMLSNAEFGWGHIMKWYARVSSILRRVHLTYTWTRPRDRLFPSLPFNGCPSQPSLSNYPISPATGLDHCNRTQLYNHGREYVLYPAPASPE